MRFRSVQRKLDRSPEELARLKALRVRYQRERPSLREATEFGGCQPVPLGEYLEAMAARRPGEQCGGCRKYKKLDTDWGWCKNHESVYCGRLMFEHDTCSKWVEGSW